jgi:hypothetical protein
MMMTRSHNAYAELLSLEASAQRAGEAWACSFSTSDEFETALIRTRRAQGRYALVRLSQVAWAGSALVAASAVFLMM